MIADTPVLDLDDAAMLEAADTGGALRSAASGGAQVRATAAAVAEGALARLDGLRPRSLLLVSGPGRAGRAAALLVAALGDRTGLPLVQVTSVPSWAGPLDVVLVAGDDAGDPRLIDAVDRAVRRGAEVVVTAPDEGPLQ
ncbi:MAG: tobH protein, partial [Nocardia sp.]|nr:tobH protein [Nocardia sp.]